MYIVVMPYSMTTSNALYVKEADLRPSKQTKEVAGAKFFPWWLLFFYGVHFVVLFILRHIFQSGLSLWPWTGTGRISRSRQDALAVVFLLLGVA